MELQDLNKFRLFEGMDEREISAVLRCIGGKTREYQKGGMIYMAGDEITSFGVVLSGAAEVVKEDVSGGRTSIALLEPGDTFGEVLAYAGVDRSPVTVVALSGVKALMIDCARVVHFCGNACEFHARLIQNLLKIIANRNLVLNQKISYLMIKSLRQKLSAFLLDQYAQRGKATFDIPYSRSGLASYLNVDRSALSRELGRMRNEGLIEFYRSTFKIKDPRALAL